MYIEHTYIEHRNPETRKTLSTSYFRYETFYYLWVKRFFDIRREAQSFYAGFSIWPRPITCGTRYKASASKRKSPFFFGPQVSTNWLFQNPPNPPIALPVHDVIHIHSLWDFYFDICERQILPAHASTPVLKFAPN